MSSIPPRLTVLLLSSFVLSCSGGPTPQADIAPRVDALGFCENNAVVSVNQQQWLLPSIEVEVGTPSAANYFLVFTYKLQGEVATGPRELVLRFVETGRTLITHDAPLTNDRLNETNFDVSLFDCFAGNCAMQEPPLDVLTVANAEVVGWQRFRYDATPQVSLCVTLKAFLSSEHPILNGVQVFLPNVKPLFRTVGP